eukprot:Rhum_TRINITY_DN14425_c8_g1::Rhum_TRINITY_DN14425_c8_g1_i1::g.90072::m.90072
MKKKLTPGTTGWQWWVAVDNVRRRGAESALKLRRQLRGRQCLEAGQGLTLQQLQRSASASRHVRDLRRVARLLRSRRRVASADDGQHALRLSQRLRHAPRAVAEVLHLEHAHRPVPDRRLRRRNRLREQRLRLGPDVQRHHARRDVGVLRQGRRHILELGRAAVVDRQQELDALRLRLLHKLVREGEDVHAVSLLVLRLRLALRHANGVALRLQERVRHGTADQDLVAHLDEVVEEEDLVRDLGAADDGDERTLRRAQGGGEVVDLLLDQVPARTEPEHLRHARHRRRVAVRGAERVRHEHVAVRREHGRHLQALGLLLRALVLVEAQVLEKQHLAGAQLRGEAARVEAVLGEADRLAQELGEAVCDGAERELGLEAVLLRTSQVRHQHQAAAACEHAADGRQGAADAQVVLDASLADGHVEVHTHEDAASLHVQLVDRRLTEVLGHFGCVEKRGRRRKRKRREEKRGWVV